MILVFMGFTQDTVRLLPSIEVKAFQLRSNPIAEQKEAYLFQHNSPSPSQNVADFLQRRSGLYLKHYGPGSLATPSVRGSSASQVAVLWNGLPIQSPMLGLTDLSLLPDFFVDELRLHYGSSGANFSNGAFGGTIHLDNHPKQKSARHGHLRSSLGSFNTRRYQAKLGFRNKNWITQTRLIHQDALNNFTYRLRKDLPEKRQTNARFQNNALFQELHWMPDSRFRVSAYLWLQGNYREIPPTTVQNKSEATQEDAILRSLVEANYTVKDHQLRLKVGHLKEDIIFRDPATKTDAQSGFKSWITDLEHAWQNRNGLQWQSGLRFHHSTAEAAGYQIQAQQNRLSLFSHLEKSWSTLKIQLGTQAEWVDDQFLPLQPDIRAQVNLSPGLILSSKIARHYRLPTLNDLYWIPGGNYQLKPEAGWSQEVSLNLAANKISMRLTGWHRLIDDWIMWSPDGGSFFWTAQNITQVRSYGLEYRMAWQRNFHHWAFKLEGGADLIRSFSLNNLNLPKLDRGQQLPYTPTDQSHISINLDYKSAKLQYNHRFTGGVAGLNESINPFNIGWLNLSYAFFKGPHSGAIFFESANLWNRTYRIVERRVMPGRTFEIGFQINLNSHKTYQ